MPRPTPLRESGGHTSQPNLGEYHDLMMNAPIGVFTATPEGRFRSVNPAMAGLHGYDNPDQMIRSITDIDNQIYADPSERTEIRRLMEMHDQVVNHDCRVLRRDGSTFWVSVTIWTVRGLDGHIDCYQGFTTDITHRKQMEEMLQKRLVALTQPMEGGTIEFEDLFNIKEIQRIQDDFARATGVASIITRPDGTHLTAPSNSTFFCSGMVRKTEKGRRYCDISDATVRRCNPYGPIVKTCPSAGLWKAGASIMVGGRHIANWLIGQVRDETQTEEQMRAYAREIGADEEAFLKAFLEVPIMPREKFERIAQALFSIANQLFSSAYQNVQQMRVIAERQHLEETLFITRFAMDQAPDNIIWADDQGNLIYANDAACTSLGYAREELLKMKLFEIDPNFPAEEWERHKINLKKHGRVTFESRHRTKDGRFFPVEVTTAYFEYKGRFHGIGFDRDITERKRTEEALQRRIIALTQPLEDSAIEFEDLFSIEEIQHIQDDFAKATGVASLITRPDGAPITAPSNFTYLCREFVRKTEKGRLKCAESDARIGQQPGGIIMQSCLSAGLWNAGASITVGGHHIANWLIGQVRDETQTEEQMRAYAREIGADEEAFLKAFLGVPIMPRGKFEQIAQALFTLAKQLSATAYQNVQQARFIAERRRAEEALRQSEIRYQSIFENTGTAMLIIEEDMTVSLSNSEFEKLTGYSQHDLEGRKWTEFVDKSDVERMIHQHHLRRRGPDARLAERSYEFRLVHRDGHRVDVLLTADIIPGTKKTVVSCIDISERNRMIEALKESERKYRELSIIDGLTQLFNSRHFFDQLKREIGRVNRYGVPMTLILLDLDNFKGFNDTYGHVEGDHALTRLGQVIKRCLRSTDSAYRYGGEEFTILLPMTRGADGVVMAERIKAEFEKEDLSSGPGDHLRLTFSMGLGQYRPKEDLKAFVHRVDQLMYQAKRKGKDRICSEP